MGPLQLLSAFNWGMALLLLAIPTFLGLMTDLPASTVLLGFGLVGLFAAPMMYLGLEDDEIETLLSALGVRVRVRGTASAQAARRAARRAAGTRKAPPARPSRRPRRDG